MAANELTEMRTKTDDYDNMKSILQVANAPFFQRYFSSSILCYFYLIQFSSQVVITGHSF